jgi:type 1 glutamine amidotransferase
MPESAHLLKPGLEKDYDAIVMYDMVGKIKPEEQKAFVALLQQGIGLVSLHHNMGAHRDWDEFRQIIGGKYCFGVAEFNDRKLRLGGDDIDGKKYGPSGYAHGQDIKVAVADRQHPITCGLADFTIHDETYCKFYVAPDVHVLLTTDHSKNDRQIAWVKQYGKSRVFYLQLGHDSQAWRNPAYSDILLRAIHWTTGR